MVNDKTSVVKHGWYSDKQLKWSGKLFIYKDLKGNQVQLTVVSNTREEHGCKYDDMTYVGEVKDFVRKIDDNSLI